MALSVRQRALQISGIANLTTAERLTEVRDKHGDNPAIAELSDPEIAEQLMDSSKTAIIAKILSVLKDDELEEARAATAQWLNSLATSAVVLAALIERYDELLGDS